MAQAQMQVGGIAIVSDRSELNNKEGTVFLQGNVQIVYKGYYLNCDQATIYRKTKRVIAKDHVTLQSPAIYSEADKIDFNFDTQLGTFYNGFIQSGKVVFEGDVIEKTGENTYQATNAKYSACANCPPSWSFSGTQIDAELGGYANIKYPILRILDFPVFVLPRILVPLKSTRQSGFLVPSLSGGGDDGLSLANHYFWAINRSSDLTYTLTSYEKRGWKNQGSYRYVIDENSRGKLNGAYIFDKGFKTCITGCKDFLEETLPEKKDRGYITYSHYYLLPDNYIQRADLAWASDLRYLRDFPVEMPGIGETALENKLSLTKNTESQNIYGEVAFYRNLLASDAFSNNNDAVHRVPNLHYSLAEQSILGSNFLYRLDSDYVNFNRSDFGYDDICSRNTSLGLPCADNVQPQLAEQGRVDTKRDGHFDPSHDLVRTGQRLNVTQQIAYPIALGNIFNLLPSITYKESQYRFNAFGDDFSPTAARRYIQFDFSVKTLFSRVLSLGEGDTQARYKHEIEPEILYSTRPWERKPNHAFFGDPDGISSTKLQTKLTDQDIFGAEGSSTLFGKNKVQFDNEDRLYSQNQVSFGIANRLIKKKVNDDGAEYVNIASFSLLQSYDIEESKKPDPHPWSEIDSILNLNLDTFEMYSHATYFPYAGPTNNTTRLRYYLVPENFIQATYTQSFTIVNNEYSFEERTEIINGSLGVKSKYFIFSGGLDYNIVKDETQSWKFDTIIRPPGDCWSIQFSLALPIGTTKPKVEFNLSFDFSGEGTI